MQANVFISFSHADPSTCHTPVNYKSSELLQESSSGQSIFAMSDISDEDTVDSKVGIRGALKVNKENSTLSADGCDSEGEEQQKVKKFSIKNFIKKSSKPKKSISVDTVQHANTNKVCTSYLKFILYNFTFTSCSMIYVSFMLKKHKDS